ncbi:probable cytochrome P450 9f2 [Lutzomyia longipalpis]|uniref:probable cytochrome P450 9f2 n=1 Tax=Lutzomyia longipalpis TaxID=7200 RepID=UPI00248453FE|nr:probable cytochrome P450 9f2 [Lutzomyia longipalpis]
MSLVWLLIALVAIVWLAIKYGLKNQHFFRERGIKFIKPLPYFGDSVAIFFNQENLLDYSIRVCNEFRREKIFGTFSAMTPTVIIRDPDILKQLTIKEFDHFSDHQPFGPKELDPLFSNSLFLLEGQKWREMRTTLSPAFTGSKMRLMSALIVEICEQMVEYLKTEAKEKGPQTHEMKDLFARIATDIIGTCAFGIKVDSLKDKDNKFYKSGKEVFDLTSTTLAMKFIALRVCPSLMRLCGITLFDETYRGFLKDLVLNNMKTRQEKNIVRPDMINLLIEAQKGTLEHSSNEKDSVGFATVEESQTAKVTKKTSWTDDEIVSQCFLFFLAGFETSSTVLSFVSYEIARNLDIQEKLYEEAKTFYDELKGKPLTYDALQKMKYLDMVVSETLRIWPPVPIIDRFCTKDFTLEYEEGKFYTFRKGEAFWIPCGDIHFDPENYPDPKKFDPERFSDENKNSIKPLTYMPFGLGPRNCIGSRFALMEVKSLIFYLIVNFHFDLSDKTEVPLILAGSMVGIKAKKGVWVKFRPRE